LNAKVADLITALIVIVFSIGAGFAVAGVLRWARVRNMAITVLIAAVAAIIFYYGSWVVWESLLARQAGRQTAFWSPQQLAQRPGAVWNTAVRINDVGTFTLNDRAVTGVELWVFWIGEAIALIGCTVVPTGVGNTDTQVTVAKTVGATGYVGTPSFLMTILKRADEMGVAPLPFQVAQVGAEALPESLRRQFEEQYGILTRQGFGTADIGMIAYECPEKSGMHLVDDAIVQVCDPRSGEPLPSGAIGEIVVTVNNATYPMLRFGTGDLTILDDGPCACGRTSARMLGWRGRADEVTKVRGMFIHPRQADEVAARTPGVQRYQVVVGRQGHEDTLTIRVELAPGTDATFASKTLETAIRDVMKLRGSVDVVASGTLPEQAKKIRDDRTY